jgi:hypothetical protein
MVEREDACISRLFSMMQGGKIKGIREKER